jgi:hypothetical protein
LQPIAILMLPDAVPALLLQPEAQMIKPTGMRDGTAGIPGPPGPRRAGGRAAPEKKPVQSRAKQCPAIYSKGILST